MALTPDQSRALLDDINNLVSMISQLQNVQQSVAAATLQIADLQQRIAETKNRAETTYAQLFT